MLKINENKKLIDLEKFGFRLNENNNYEYKKYYDLEDDGTRYIDDNGFDYIWSIEIYKRENRNELYLEVINNDCSYHNEGDELEEIMCLIYKLTKYNIIVLEED